MKPECQDAWIIVLLCAYCGILRGKDEKKSKAEGHLNGSAG